MNTRPVPNQPARLRNGMPKYGPVSCQIQKWMYCNCGAAIDGSSTRSQLTSSHVPSTIDHSVRPRSDDRVGEEQRREAHVEPRQRNCGRHAAEQFRPEKVRVLVAAERPAGFRAGEFGRRRDDRRDEEEDQRAPHAEALQTEREHRERRREKSPVPPVFVHRRCVERHRRRVAREQLRMRQRDQQAEQAEQQRERVQRTTRDAPVRSLPRDPRPRHVCRRRAAAAKARMPPADRPAVRASTSTGGARTRAPRRTARRRERTRASRRRANVAGAVTCQHGERDGQRQRQRLHEQRLRSIRTSRRTGRSDRASVSERGQLRQVSAARSHTSSRSRGRRLHRSRSAVPAVARARGPA